MAGIARDKSTNQKRPKWSRGALGSGGQDAAARFGEERYLVMLFAVLYVSIADFAEVDMWSGSVAAFSAPFGERGRLHRACAD